MTTKSPSLDVITKDGAKPPVGAVGPERRRLPRLNLAGELFRLSRTGKVYSVYDLSPSGMALKLLDKEEFGHFPVASQISGTLNLHGNKVELQAKVRHLGADTVGCEFQELAPAVRDVITRFLDPVALGGELKPIPSPEVGSLWYRGPSGTSLFLWRGADGQFFRYALFVLGTYIQWSENDGIATGRAVASDDAGEVRGIVRFETMLLEPDAAPDSGKLSIAKNLLLSSNLPADLKKWCVRHLSS